MTKAISTKPCLKSKKDWLKLTCQIETSQRFRKHALKRNPLTLILGNKNPFRQLKLNITELKWRHKKLFGTVNSGENALWT